MPAATLYYALLSGMHASLPVAELRGILEAGGHRYRVVERLDQLVVYEASGPGAARVAWRAGLIHEAGRVLAVADAEESSLLDAVGMVDWCLYLRPGDRVVFTLTRVKGYARSRVPGEAARRAARLAEPLLRRCGAVATPRGATRRVSIIVSQGVALVGLVEDEQPKEVLEAHKPSRKPFFHPGSLDPRLARLFVNLARAAPPGPYVDPFCGTGGFAVEAQWMGIYSVCGELDERLARGSRLNALAEHAAALVDNARWDALRIPLRDHSAQSIGTDPPYGRSSSTRGRALEQLLRGFLEEAARILARGAYLSFAYPHWAEGVAEDALRRAGLRLLEKHYMRVHGSLTRIVAVAAPG